MPKILIGISILLMTLSLLFGLLNTSKVKTLRTEIVSTSSARDRANGLRLVSEKKLKTNKKDLAAANDKAVTAQAQATSAAAALSKAQSDKAEVEAKLQTSEGQIADLQKRVADATAGEAAAGPEGAAPNDSKSTLDEMKRQLQAAEDEKVMLADKVRAAQDRVATLEDERKRRRAGANTPGVHGTVLAVNQAYNFVVLSVGERQGVVSSSEMLVMRAGSLIGKIRISSVEPTTSIGDIISNSLPRGVQVQPGDTVVYAGTNNS